MDFLNSLLTSLLQGLAGLIIAVTTWVATFAPIPLSPIVITPAVKERAEYITPFISATTEAQEDVEQEPRGGEPLLDVNGLARSATVNIFCVGNGPLRSASGSGMIIDQRGVILTNAHVGQFFLLSDYPKPNTTLCTIRAGSPARVVYEATLLYLPQAWIAMNVEKIRAHETTGTGEHDYAFLLITRMRDGTELPEIFPSIGYTIEEPKAGDPMLLSGYPSAFLSNKAVVNNLLLSSTFTIVKKIFSYDPPHTVDLFSIGSTTISQSGASGGGAARASDGKLMGIIAIASEAEVVEDRDLRAITLAHINRSLSAHGMGGINELLSGDLSEKTAQFEATIAPALRTQLINALEE